MKFQQDDPATYLQSLSHMSKILDVEGAGHHRWCCWVLSQLSKLVLSSGQIKASARAQEPVGHMDTSFRGTVNAIHTRDLARQCGVARAAPISSPTRCSDYSTGKGFDMPERCYAT